MAETSLWHSASSVQVARLRLLPVRKCNDGLMVCCSTNVPLSEAFLSSAAVYV